MLNILMISLVVKMYIPYDINMLNLKHNIYNEQKSPGIQ